MPYKDPEKARAHRNAYYAAHRPVVTCARCGIPAPQGRSRYCSDKCRNADRWARLHPVTPPPPRPCAVCGQLFTPRYNDRAEYRPKASGKPSLYCREACASREHRRRRLERVGKVSRPRRPGRDAEVTRAVRRAQAQARGQRLVRIGDGVRVKIDDLPATLRPIAELIRATHVEIRKQQRGSV